MALTTYKIPDGYSIQNDFPNHKVAPDRLTQQIQQSAIVTALDSINTSGDLCAVIFKAALSTGDVTILDGIVATHSGEPLPNDVPAPVQSYSGVATPSPITTDGRPVALNNLFPDYVMLYMAGAGDDSTTGRGNGTVFQAQSDAAGDTDVEFYFNDWIYIAGGNMRVEGAALGDYATFEVHAPATPVTASGSNTGNCNLVDPGVGAAILIVPAAGNGAYNVDLTQAVPINSFNTDVPRQPTGYWDWSAPDTGLGTVTPGAPGHSGYNLFSVALDPMVRFMAKFPLLGDNSINLTIPAISPKTILPQWILRVRMHNSGHAGLKLCWGLVTARVKTT